MQVTHEKIPALRRFDPVITLLNNILQESEFDVFTSRPKFWIAGGSILSAVTQTKINDYDVFSDNPDSLKSMIIAAGYEPTFSSAHFTNFYIEKYKIQIITKFAVADPSDLFDTFDLTIVCAAYDGDAFYCHDRFWQDVASKRMVVNSVKYPMRIMERMMKYAGRGYKPCPIGLATIARSINELTINWGDPHEDHLTFYSDGTPRFTGVD